MSRHPFFKRLLKEYQGLCTTSTLPGITMVSNDDSLTEFLFQIKVANNKLYPENEQYFLSIIITPNYPVDSPQVKFVIHETHKGNAEDPIVIDDNEPEETKSVIPMHPHIYSNGHICLNLLGDDWTPACSIESTLLSIQSMLNTNDRYERPPDDASYIKGAPLNPKNSRFVYHDDSV
ncbi:Ubiquitin-conjugating enzyme, putative (Ubiquitin carrier protein, putative) [Candida maltosa Xu316]|uniref:Ubiquitin-conjugating enzyme, putative (Ubiquitin carrier protein, putative) n=1 Tax=Candida maltosa (strain Xu316) TaxID=1245528 RepID=M3K3U5_CANMX|nr:Ubiquitin-conjugating enzyme, putative (Ubiquitin carrier protein, putative) [Candida maltosa Xu316]